MQNCNIIAVNILLFITGFIVIPATASGDRCTLTVLSLPDKAAITIDGTLTGSGLSLGAMSFPGQADPYAHTPAQVFVL